MLYFTMSLLLAVILCVFTLLGCLRLSEEAIEFVEQGVEEEIETDLQHQKETHGSLLCP